MESIEKTGGSLEVLKNPLLRQLLTVHEARLQDPNAPLPKGFVSEREVERRFRLNLHAANIRSLPDLDRFMRELLAQPGAYSRTIDQANVEAYKDSSHKETISIRLRKTQMLYPSEKKEHMYRITLKTSVGSEDIDEKEETQLQIDLNSPDTTFEQKQMFLGLFERGILKNLRTRIYIPGVLPYGNEYEIHFEIYSLPEMLTDITRLEVEFKNVADARYVRANKHVLPPWIGIDVTNERAWKSKRLVRDGVPMSAIEELEKIKLASR